MKALITGLAFIILMTFFNVFQIDQDAYIRAQSYVKFLADDTAAGASLFQINDTYSNGLKVYDVVQAEALVKDLITKNLRLSSDLSPKQTSHWKGPVSYTTYYFDDNKECQTYVNGVFSKRENFNYNTIFEEPLTKYKKLITEPTVIVTISVGSPANRSDWIDWPDIIRSSAYEDLDRN